MEPREILKRPYARVLTPEPDGQYTAEIMEFPSCVAYGENEAAALANLEQVALDWIAATVEQGHDIPEPLSAVDYSGKLVLRMTKGLHARAALLAEREGVSLNQFIVTCLAEAVGEKSKPKHVPQVQAIANVSFHLVAGSADTNATVSGVAQAHRNAAQLASSGPIQRWAPQWQELGERKHA
jgi:predicted HicB family RNase H-like nuclease